MVDISHLNTLRIPTNAENVLEINSAEDIKKVDFSKSYLILGSGANVLFTKDFPGNILLIKILGRKIISETSDDITIEFGAGENWHEAVTWAVENTYSGMENMALIPGTVGAAAVGNIAAYGQNQEDIFVSLKTHNSKIFDKNNMQFAYRESILKNNSNYIVTSVTYKLSKKTHLELSYHATHHASLLPTLQSIAKEPFTVKNVYDAVIKIRQEKLPDPKNIGTAGSFFKNPVVSAKISSEIKSKFPDLQTYPVAKLQYIDSKENMVKLPAGFLLDKLGWRGKRIGNVGTYPSHALTIVTYPGVTGQEVYNFAELMRADVKKNFNIDLEYEVIIV